MLCCFATFGNRKHGQLMAWSVKLAAPKAGCLQQSLPAKMELKCLSESFMFLLSSFLNLFSVMPMPSPSHPNPQAPNNCHWAWQPRWWRHVDIAVYMRKLSIVYTYCESVLKCIEMYWIYMKMSLQKNKEMHVSLWHIWCFKNASPRWKPRKTT